MNTMTEFLHYFGVTCLVASLLIRVLPAPEEIDWKPYAVFYGIVHRASLNLPNLQNGGRHADTEK